MPRGRCTTAAVVVFTVILAACGGGGSPTAPGAATNLQGVWEGTWVKASCSETGAASGQACNLPESQSGGLRLTLTQSENTVQGTVEVGPFAIPATGSVSGNTLTLTGQARRTIDGQGVTGSLSNWSTTRNGNSMSGSFTLRIVWDNASLGTQTLGVSLQNVNKTS